MQIQSRPVSKLRLIHRQNPWENRGILSDIIVACVLGAGYHDEEGGCWSRYSQSETFSFFGIYYSPCPLTSVANPDPHGFAFIFGRLDPDRIGSGSGSVSRGAKMNHKSEENSSFEVLDVSAVICFSIFVQTLDLDPDPHWKKLLDPGSALTKNAGSGIRIETNADLQHCISYSEGTI